MSAAPPRLFGTDGIRALAGDGPLAATALPRLGRAIAEAARAAAPEAPPLALCARDPRPSGAAIAAGLARGMAEGGMTALDAGVLPTPAVSFACRHPDAWGAERGLALGIVISASHNPPAWNGIKVFAKDGVKASDPLERAIEARFAALGATGSLPSDDGAGHRGTHALGPEAPAPGPTEPGPALAALGALPALGAPAGAPASGDPGRLRAAYMDALVRLGGGDGALAGLRLACDCAFGATAAVAPAALARLGAEVRWVAAEPLGERINDGVGALHPEACARAVLASGAACGFSFDGDGDRVIAVDERGRVQDGDALLYALARWLHGRGALPGEAIAATVMSSFGLERSLAALGIGLVRTDVGDRHVTAALLARGLALGGEQSGHLVLASLLGPTGDGVGAALALLAAHREQGGPFSALFDGFAPAPQSKRGLPAARKPALEGIPAARAALADAERALAGRGRLLVRYSGTEPLLRILVEHEDGGAAAAIADALAERLAALPDLAGGV